LFAAVGVVIGGRLAALEPTLGAPTYYAILAGLGVVAAVAMTAAAGPLGRRLTAPARPDERAPSAVLSRALTGPGIIPDGTCERKGNPMSEPNAILRGGQLGQLVEEQRLCVVADNATEHKIDLGNCYDHFVVTAERASATGVSSRYHLGRPDVRG